MKIAWLLSEQLTSTIDVEKLKDSAPTWGSCKIFNKYLVDNVICNDIKTIKKLTDRQVQKQTNLFVPADIISQLGNPPNLKGYQGEFADPNINFKDDIVALNVVSSMYDIILLVGFKFTKPKSTDKLKQHKQLAYLHNIKTIVETNEDKQFVLVNYKGKLSKDFDSIDNLTRDSLGNVLELVQGI